MFRVNDVNTKVLMLAIAFVGLILNVSPRAYAGGYRHSEITATIEALKSADLETRRQAAMKLAEMGPEAKDAVPALVIALSDPNPGIKDEAVTALEKMGASAKDAIPALIAFLQDRSIDQVRSKAAMALGNMGADGAPAVPALIEALSDDQDVVRRSAARALADLGNIARSAIQPLIKTLNTDDVGLRQNACLAIMQIGLDPSDLQSMVPYLSDEIDCIRSCAARAVGDLGPKAIQVVPVLSKLVDDPSGYVRIDAYKALKQIDPHKKRSLPSVSKDLFDDYSQDTNGLWFSTWSTMSYK